MIIHHVRDEMAEFVVPFRKEIKVYKFKFDLQPGSLTDQVAGEHQPSYKHP